MMSLYKKKWKMLISRKNLLPESKLLKVPSDSRGVQWMSKHHFEIRILNPKLTIFFQKNEPSWAQKVKIILNWKRKLKFVKDKMEKFENKGIMKNQSAACTNIKWHFLTFLIEVVFATIFSSHFDIIFHATRWRKRKFFII